MAQKTIQLFGVVGDPDGITEEKVLDALPKSGDVLLEINSPGGDVFVGFAIFNKLKDFAGEISVDILGQAASMASYLAMAGTKRTIRRNARMMIHNPFTGRFGDAKRFEKTAEELKALTEEMAQVYADATGIEFDKIKDMMDEETWMDAGTADKLGFAKEVEGSPEKKVKSYSAYLLEQSGYKKVPPIYASMPDDDEVITDEENQMLDKIKKLLGVEKSEDVFARVEELIAKMVSLEEKIVTLEKAAKSTPGPSLEPADKNIQQMLVQQKTEITSEYTAKLGEKDATIDMLVNQVNDATTFVQTLRKEKREEVLKSLVGIYINAAQLELAEAEKPSIYEVSDAIFNAKVSFMKAGGPGHAELLKIQGVNSEDDDDGTVPKTAQDETVMRAKKLVAAEKFKTMAEAQEAVWTEDPGLRERYDVESWEK
jgi:ATP-dependent Clp endopeptidase proteolytic subunit ClpP